MQYIVSFTEKAHAIAGYREHILAGGKAVWSARSRCGRTITGNSSGEAIVSFINCDSCRRSLRRDGWLV